MVFLGRVNGYVSVSALNQLKIVRWALGRN